MKNFTNNFKQFTSRLSARWLIMALMLLVGTGSAWAAYYVTGDAFGSWGTWYELKYETANRYTRSISNINGEFKLSSGQTYDNCWNSLGCGNGVKCGGGSNHKMLGVTGILCFDPSGNNGNGYIWVEEVIQEPSAYSLGGYINQSDVKSYSDTYKLTKQSDGTYKRTISFTKVHNNAQYLWIIDDLGNKWGVSSDTDLTTGNSITLTKGVESGKVKAIGVIDTDYVFIFNPSNGELSYLASCSTPNFSVSLSKSEVAVGCTGVTASITGDDRPTVTWSSSDPKVATIDSDGAITIKAAGTTTITATTTEAGGFCGGVEKPATLTVKSPSVKVSENKNSLCEGETLTLTATLTNCGADNSIQWYKEANPIAGETSATLTISSVTTANSGNYKAVVSGGILCSSVASTPITITVNALPNAPILTTGSTNVCPGTLTLANFKAMAEQNTVVWYSNEECTQVVTTPTVEKGGTYKFYAKSKNASGCFSEGYSTLEVKVYDEPADFTLTAIPAEICSGADVIISISNKQDGVTYKLGNETIDESIKVNPTEDTEYYTVTAYLNACPDLTKSISTDIKVNPIPSFTVDPTNLSLCKGSTSVTDLTVLSHVEVANGDPVWYDAETAGNVVTEGADLIKGGTYWVAAENAETGCINPERKAFTITIHDLPKYPDLKKRSAAVCQEANATVSLNELAEITDVIWYQGENEVQGPDAISIAEAGTFTYTAKAVNSNGCQSATGVDFILTVNLLPNVSIAGNTSAVFYEDVQLTATATDGATVKWYEGGEEKATGATYVVTSETATSKTVTAKAFLNGCESIVASHTVAFSAAEDCTPTPDNTKIEIWCKVTGTTTPYCHAYNIKNSGNKEFKQWPGLTHTSKSGDYYIWTLEKTNGLDISNNEVGIVFSKNSSGNNQTADITTFYVGNRYYFTYNANSNDKNKNYTKGDSESLTTPVPLSTPAVKTVSATSEEGSGIVTFTGKLLKTGCATGSAIWVGYQYKKANEEWPTTGVTAGSGEKQLVSIENNPGSEDFTVNVEGLENGNYHFRAYIINGYNFTNGNYDQGVYYGLDKLVTVSTTKTPISNVTLNYCDENGGNVGVDPNPMCKGATAYVKLSYEGSKYSDIKWLVEGVETNLVTDKGNDVWSYIIQGTGHLSVELRNDANKDNEDNPTWATSDKLSFTMKEEPVAPYISINPASGVICQGTSATIKVENPSTACSYKLVEGDTETGFTKYESGDLKYTVQNVGKYYVVALHDACTDNEYTSNQVAINQIISTSAKISIEPKNQETTPWEPVNITVTADEGYVYEVTYTGNNLQDVDGVIIKQKGDTYTYYIPRPTGWGEGNAISVRTPVAYGIKAQLKVDGEANQCNLSFDTATITVKDEKDEDCD